MMAMLLSQAVVSIASAAEKAGVTIDPIISTGREGGYRNAAPNIWLTLDQSVSMFAMMPGIVIGNYKKVPNKKPYHGIYQPIKDEGKLTGDDWEKYVNNMELAEAIGVGLQQGYIPYDEGTTYEIPVDYKGRELPIPDDANYTWQITYANKRVLLDKSGVKTNHSHPLPNENGTISKYQLSEWTPITTPRDIFMVYAEYMWNTDLCYIKRGDRKADGAINILETKKCLTGAKLDSYLENTKDDKTKTPNKLKDILSDASKGDFKMPITQRYIWSRYASDERKGIKIDAYVKKDGQWHGLIPGLNKAGIADGNLASLMFRENTCELAKKKKNCQIWSAFYSNRVSALKSGLSLALYKNLVNKDGTYKDVRYGYQVFQEYIEGNPRTRDNQIAKKFQQLASQGKKTTDLKNNNEENLKELFEWLFTYTPEVYGQIGTEMRGSVANLLRDIKRDAMNGKIFREDLTDEKSEQYTCRQNHNILFTDGGWGDDLPGVADNPLKGQKVTSCTSKSSCTWSEANTDWAYTDKKTENDIDKLPDGKKYKAMLPYIAKNEGTYMSHLADLAFRAWITDLDNNPNNNKAGQSGFVVVPDKKDLPTYIKPDGTEGVYENPNAADNKAFWHPFYDMATWQHINTHAVGFGLNETEYKDIHINPPKDEEEAKKLFKMTKVDAKIVNGEKTDEEVSLIDGENAVIQRTAKQTEGQHKVIQERAITDMARAAMTGRGLFFNAKSGKDVVQAFNEIIARISEPPTEKAATTGSSGSSASSGNIGNVYMTTRYDEKSFTGELTKKDIYNGERPDLCFADFQTDETANAHEKRLNHRETVGDFCDRDGAGWNAATELNKVDVKKRNILTVKLKLDDKKLKEGDIATADVNKFGYEIIDFADDAFKISETLAGNDTVSLYQRRQLLKGICGDAKTKDIFAKMLSVDADKQNDWACEDKWAWEITANNKLLAKLFNYVRGDAADEQKFDDCKYNGNGYFRSRSQYDYSHSLPAGDCGTDRNILGALVRSSAVFAGKPNLALAHLSVKGKAYIAYKDNVLKKYCDPAKDGKCTEPKKEAFYIGSNDGMLHAFDAKTGEEIFAYIPNIIYERLPQTIVPKKKLSLIDGKIALEWVNLGTDTDEYTGNDNNDDWQQILVGGLAGGGKGLYALNVSDADASKVKSATSGNWEYGELQSKRFNNGGDSNVGNIMWEPAIIQLKDNTWVAVTGNGYNSQSGKAALIMIDLATGKPIQELVLPKNLAKQANGLSQLYFASYANKNAKTEAEINKAMKKINVVDRAYAGDLQGNLWVFDFTEATKDGGVKVVNDKPLFTAKATVDGKEVRQPITATPLVVEHPTKRGYLVHFGTGALFAVDDLSSKVPNSLFGIWDDWIATEHGGLSVKAGETQPRDTSVADNEINVVEYNEVSGKLADGTSVAVRYLKEKQETKWNLTTPTGGDRGWRINLQPHPFDNSGSERAWQSPKMIYGTPPQEVLNYRTVRYLNTAGTKSQCGGGKATVEGWDMVFDPRDAGKALKNSALDTNGDGVVNDDDFVEVKTADGKIIKIPVTAVKTEGKFKTNVSYNNLVRDSAKACQIIKGSSNISDSEIENGSFTVCSYISSWKELRQEKKKK